MSGYSFRWDLTLFSLCLWWGKGERCLIKMKSLSSFVWNANDEDMCHIQFLNVRLPVFVKRSKTLEDFRICKYKIICLGVSKKNNKREKELAGCQITYITVIDLLTPDFCCREMYWIFHNIRWGRSKNLVYGAPLFNLRFNKAEIFSKQQFLGWW